MIHQLWRDQQQPKDEGGKAEFKRMEEELTGRLGTVGRSVEDENPGWVEWRPEGLPDSAPSWW